MGAPPEHPQCTVQVGDAAARSQLVLLIYTGQAITTERRTARGGQNNSSTAAAYNNIHLTLIPSNSSPKRERSPKGVEESSR